MICFDKSISDRKGRSRLFPRLFYSASCCTGWMLRLKSQTVFYPPKPARVLGRRRVCSHRRSRIRLSSDLPRNDGCFGRIIKEMQPLSTHWLNLSDNTSFQSNQEIWKCVCWVFAPLTILSRQTLQLRKSKQSGQVLFYRSWGIERGAFSDDEFYATVARNDGCDSRGLCVP